MRAASVADISVTESDYQICQVLPRYSDASNMTVRRRSYGDASLIANRQYCRPITLRHQLASAPSRFLHLPPCDTRSSAARLISLAAQPVNRISELGWSFAVDEVSEAWNGKCSLPVFRGVSETLCDQVRSRGTERVRTLTEPSCDLAGLARTLAEGQLAGTYESTMAKAKGAAPRIQHEFLITRPPLPGSRVRCGFFLAFMPSTHCL